MDWATAVVNAALSIVGLLPTPQLRTAALLAVLRTEVTQRSGKGTAAPGIVGQTAHTMPVVPLPTDDRVGSVVAWLVCVGTGCWWLFRVGNGWR